MAPRSLWDALFDGAGELLMRQPGIVSLHAVTTTNALHYAFQASADDRTRKLLLLQGAGVEQMAVGGIDLGIGGAQLLEYRLRSCHVALSEERARQAQHHAGVCGVNSGERLAVKRKISEGRSLNREPPLACRSIAACAAFFPASN